MIMYVSPSEAAFCGLYFSPLLIICIGGLVTAMATVRILEARNLMNRFWHPTLAVTAMAAGYSSLFALFTTTP